MIFVTENANFATSGDEKVNINVNGNVKVTGTLGENIKFDEESTGKVILENESSEETNGKNITDAFKAGAKDVELAPA